MHCVSTINTAKAADASDVDDVSSGANAASVAASTANDHYHIVTMRSEVCAVVCCVVLQDQHHKHEQEQWQLKVREMLFIEGDRRVTLRLNLLKKPVIQKTGSVCIF